MFIWFYSDEGEKKLDSEKGQKEITEPVVTISKEIPDEVSQKEKKEKEGNSIKSSERPNANEQKKNNSKRSRRRKKKRVSTKSETKLKKQGSTEKPVKQDKQDLIGNIEQEHSENEDIGGEHLYDSVEDSDDDDHVYESVCESSDEDDDEREYYNIDEFNDQIENVKSKSNPDLTDPYRDDPPPLPPRPSDDSAEEGSSNETKDSKVKNVLPKKPPRNLRRQKSKEELTDSESEDIPRLPARLYNPDEENSPTQKSKAEPASLQSEQIKEKETSSDNANAITPSLPPRLYDEEEELRANKKSLGDKSKENGSSEEGMHNINSNNNKSDSENFSAPTETNENGTPL